MKTLARFVIRPTSKTSKKGNLVLGAMFKPGESDLLKPNTVYEIQEFDGTLMIRPVGKAAIGHDLRDSKIQCSWSNTVDHVLHNGGMHLLTDTEVEAG